MCSQRVRASSSKPTASAQPMSRLSDFQPGKRRQALHLLPMTMPMPTPELASEKAWGSMMYFGMEMFLKRKGSWRVCDHHQRSLSVPRGGERGTKGRSEEKLSMVSKEVRYARPSSITKHEWRSFP